MSVSHDWRGETGDAWAEEWPRTDRTLAPVNDALVAEAVAHAAAGARILDLGCGGGATSLALADALPEARITGVDLSSALVAVARARAGEGGRLSFEVGDAASWSPAEAAFDLIVSRHGVMFFDDPVAAFTHIKGLARPGASLIFSCFRDRRDNEWVRAMRPVFERFAPETLAAPEPPTGPFAFGDPRRIYEILCEAGFAAPEMAPLDFDFVVGAGEEPIAGAMAYFTRVGPIAVMLRGIAEADRAAATAMIASIAAEHERDGRIAFAAAAWIVRSVRP